MHRPDEYISRTVRGTGPVDFNSRPPSAKLCTHKFRVAWNERQDGGCVPWRRGDLQPLNFDSVRVRIAAPNAKGSTHPQYFKVVQRGRGAVHNAYAAPRVRNRYI